MTTPWILYGVRQWGSTIAEGMLAVAGIEYEFRDVTGFDQPGAARDRLLDLNPLAQVPTLVLPSGDVLTETAAIALLCADGCEALAPGPGHPLRARFLRLLVWLVAAVYPTFTYGDYPERWAAGAPQDLRHSTDQARNDQYLWLATQCVGPHVLGERFSALDIYVACLIHWRPRRQWFEEHAPCLVRIAQAAAGMPAMREVLERNGFV